jgi:hypothetical protein
MNPIVIDTTKVTQQAVSRVFGNWKTTTAGVGFFAFTVLQGVKFDAVGHLAMTQRDWFGIGLGLLGAFIGSVQRDAGTQQAELPSGEVADVPSYENPDNPAAKPIVGGK